MIINQTTTLIFEYPQDYLQEQEWCKTKEDRWIHKGTDTLGAVYENTISYSIGQSTDCKTENSSEISNNSTISKMEQVDKDINVRSKDEPKICDTCRYYNSNIPCGSTPSACKEADKFAEEFVDGLKKLKPKVEPQTSPTISKMEQVEDEQITSKLIDIENSAVSGYESTMSQPKSKLKDEPQTEECEEPNYYDPALWERRKVRVSE